MTVGRVVVLLLIAAAAAVLGMVMTREAMNGRYRLGGPIIAFEYPEDAGEYHEMVRRSEAGALRHHVFLDAVFIVLYVLLFVLYNWWAPGPARMAVVSAALIVLAGLFDVGEDVSMLVQAARSASADVGLIAGFAALKWVAFFAALGFLAAKMPLLLAVPMIGVSVIAAAVSIGALRISECREWVPPLTGLLLLLTTAHLVWLLIKAFRTST